MSSARIVTASDKERVEKAIMNSKAEPKIKVHGYPHFRFKLWFDDKSLS